MKIHKLLFCAALLIFTQPIFAQDESETENDDTQIEISVEDVDTGKTENQKKFFLTFDYGLASAYVTRIQKQTTRSNFVMSDTLVGLYFSTKLQNGDPISIMARLAAYYPILKTFNQAKQSSKQTLLYALDFSLIPFFEISSLKFMRVDLGIGLHFLYELTDEFHYISLGGQPLIQVELPLAKRWSVIFNGMVSLDNGNIGSNTMFPIDVTYEYQVSLGARYSKKSINSFSYIGK